VGTHSSGKAGLQQRSNDNGRIEGNDLIREEGDLLLKQRLVYGNSEVRKKGKIYQ
jgi:hypothetical protein